jgi:gingipain R
MHPFIWSVACVNGDFVSGTCLAEAFTRAGTPAKPTGALATLMSTINQSWNPPMAGQDAMIDILVESKAGNIKRTFGGLSMNGCMQMNDSYPKGGSGDFGAEMTDTWTLFGDPSVMVFTNTPAAMTVSHVSKTPLNTTKITVSCNVKDALICLSKDGVILGTGISNGTSADITIPAAAAGTIDVVATAYNKMTYTGNIVVDGTTGVDELANANHLQIYPVPASEAITIAGELTSAGKIKLAIYNSLGQEVLLISNESAAAGSFTKTIDVSELTAGVYFCKLETGIATQIQRVIIQH